MKHDICDEVSDIQRRESYLTSLIIKSNPSAAVTISAEQLLNLLYAMDMLAATVPINSVEGRGVRCQAHALYIDWLRAAEDANVDAREGKS